MEPKNRKQPSHLNKKIAIIGAGASGLLSSILLAQKGFDVTVFEKNSKAGRKLLATGNGKCNISNTDISTNHFFSTNTAFINHTLQQFDYQKFNKLFSSLGLETAPKDGTKVYPLSLQAASVVNILVDTAKFYGVKFYFNSEISDINYKQNFELQWDNNTFKADVLIICTGSKAMKKLGSSDSGYKFAKQFHHNIIKPFASLVQLTSNHISLSQINGIKLYSTVTLYINNQQSTRLTGDILFRDYGISGSAILDISREVAYALSLNQKVTISIDMLPDFSKEKLISLLTHRKQLLKNKKVNFLLESILPVKLIPFMYQKSNITNKTYIEQLTKKDIHNIIFQIKNLKLSINGTKGFEHCEVVAGGIDTSQIDPKTMMSKLQPNLYFCGEVLDVDGKCGGYNLHWAWGSSFICTNSIIKQI